MPPLEVYEGDRPYIFVNYAHADDRVVLPIIGSLVTEGYRVWYDDGIQPATYFPDYIADHIHDCACFVMFVPRASLASPWCKREVEYALSCRKPILPVYLEDVELSRGLKLILGSVQSVFWHWYESDEAFYRRLFDVRALDTCLTLDGWRRRGVQPRPSGKGATGFRESEPRPVDRDAGKAGDPNPASSTSQPRQRVASQSHSADSAASGAGVDHGDDGQKLRSQPSAKDLVVVGFAPKGGFAAYTWAEIKELSRAIAAADEGAWLDIAKGYNLVDEGGRLRGETKAVTLKDRRKTTAQIRILGFRHDNLAVGGKAGISFEFADVPAEHRMNPGRTNEGGWGASEMRGWLNDGRAGFLSLLPDDLRPLVEAAAKRTNNRGRVRENDTACVTATDDRLWLLSMSEVYGKLSAQKKNVPWSPATYDAEGEQYKLYADKGVSTSSFGSCGKDRAFSWWWLRSPHANGTYGFRIVYGDGVWNLGYARDGWGVSPGFCF